MAEDQNTATQTNTSEAPVNTPPTPPAGVVTLNQKDHADLVAKAARVDQLSKEAELAVVARKAFGKDVPDEQRVDAIARVMAAAGYTQDEIMAHLTEGEPDRQPAQRRNSRAGDQEIPTPSQSEFQELKATVEQNRYEQLNETMNNSVGQHFKEGTLAKLVGDISEGRSQEEIAELTSTLQSDMVQITKNLLRQKRDSLGEFRKEWIPEAAKQAADQVAKKVRLFGGANKVGRSQELDLAEDEFLKSTPKTLPKNPIKGVGDVDKALTEFTNDALSRIAAEASRGGSTRV